jgi:hypothetical protein
LAERFATHNAARAGACARHICTRCMLGKGFMHHYLRRKSALGVLHLGVKVSPDIATIATTAALLVGGCMQLSIASRKAPASFRLPILYRF